MPNHHLRTPDAEAIPSALFEQELAMLSRFEARAADFLNSQAENFAAPRMAISCKFIDERLSSGFHACQLQRSKDERYQVLIPVTLLGVLLWLGRALNSIPFLEIWSEHNDSSEILQSHLIDRLLKGRIAGEERLSILAKLNYELPFDDNRLIYARGFVSAILKFIAGHEFAHIYQSHLHLRAKLEEGGYCNFTEREWLHGAEFTADNFGLENLIQPMGRAVTTNQVAGLLWSLGSFFAGIYVRERNLGTSDYPPATIRYALVCQTIRDTDELLVENVLETLSKDLRRLSRTFRSEILEQYAEFVEEVVSVESSELVSPRLNADTVRNASVNLFRDRPSQFIPTHIVRINMY